MLLLKLFLSFFSRYVLWHFYSLSRDMSIMRKNLNFLVLMRAGLLPKQLKTQCLKIPQKISFLKKESIETFFGVFQTFCRRYSFWLSSLKLETRFTLETTMKSGTQTKKNREKKFRGNSAWQRFLRHLIYAIYPVKFLFTKWIREFLTLKSRYVTMQAVIR